MELERLLEFYHACFSDNIRSQETVRKVLTLPGNRCLTEQAEGAEAGAAVVNGNTVLMLCVLPGYRGQGVGSRLLERCEGLVRENGYEEIQFCDGPEYLTPGIPLTGRNLEFFTKRGYVHSWGDCECVDMSLTFGEVSDDGGQIGEESDGVVYRWADLADREAVTACVKDGWEEFAPYYQREELYRGGGPERVLAAFQNGLACGALLVGFGQDFPGVGSVGCTVTRTAFQRRGVATRLVRLGTAALREAGLAKSFLGYTYTDIVPLYQRCGYSVSQKYLMGKKPLR